MTIPGSIGAITAEWLNGALEDNGVDHPGVAAVGAGPMPGIVGMLGEVGLVDITWAGATDLPTTMVGKCPLDDDTARLYNQVMQTYTREAGFYRDLADKVPMAVPRCFVNAESDDKQQQMLLIEKIEGTDGDILVGADFDTVALLVEKMAKMHGRFWMDQEMADLPWMLDWRAESFKLGIPIVQDGWNTFAEREPDTYSKELAHFCAGSWVNDTEHWLDLYAQRDWTYVHADFELDNMMHTDDDVVVFDWQTCLKTFPGVDLAWLLATSETDEVVAREGELIDHYRSVLAQHGGPDWSHDQVVEELAWGVLYPAACQPVTQVQDLTVYGDKAERMAARLRAFLERSIRAAERWDLVGHCGPLLR